jgi:hypothetical protein
MAFRARIGTGRRFSGAPLELTKSRPTGVCRPRIADNSSPKFTRSVEKRSKRDGRRLLFQLDGRISTSIAEPRYHIIIPSMACILAVLGNLIGFRLI